MPIQKIPIVHKFGIISQTQRLELQERLLKQSYTDNGSQKAQGSSRNPIEVTEEFVHQFNAAEGLDEQEKLEATAQKMLARIKRRAGLKDGGKGSHVDLPVAWTELSQLAQCKGKVQEDCLDVLILSLDQAPLSKHHVPALFFLAETCLYWLRTDAINQPYLRTAELKILKMGYLVFARLFHHHMAGQLQRHDEFKNRLFTYLDGFGECQESYNPYPNALLCIRYINEVGKMIIGASAGQPLEPGEVKEGDPRPDLTHHHQLEGGEEEEEEEEVDVEDQELFHEVPVHYEETPSHHSGAISSSVHDLSPTLWHALDVWRCTNHLSGGLPDALNALSCCGTGLATESWVDGICALHVLADAAKVKLSALKVLQDLARGAPPPPDSPRARLEADKSAVGRRTGTANTGQSSSYMDSKGLSDIYEKTEDGSSRPSRERRDIPDDMETQATSRGGKPPPASLNYEKTFSSVGSKQTDYTRVNTGWKAEVGSAADRMSQASTVPTYTNQLDDESAGLHGWHWEVAITYTDLLADIVLHGNSSEIQKMALVGTNKNMTGLDRRPPQCPMPSAGLMDLVYFTARGEAMDGSSNDWSWRIRYSALQALVRLCQSCAGEVTKEGMHAAAWATLTRIHSWEKDTRVLEALKVGQVDASLEKVLSTQLQVPPSAIGAKMANGLSALYLPPLPPPVDSPVPRKHVPSTKSSPRKVQPTHKKPLRTSLKDEIELATALYEPAISYNNRTDYDLKRVLEDQLRKDLQQELEEEDEVRQKQLKAQQKQAELAERQAEQSRKEKLKEKYKRKAYELPKKSGSGTSRNKLLSPKTSAMQVK